MHLTTLDHCSACGGCENICPRGCISMANTVTGDRRPVIDEDKCVSCGLCVKVCPHLNEVQMREPEECYAAYRSDKKKRLDSASGGIGALLYETFFSVHENAVVYGVCWDSKTERVTYTSAVSPDDVDKFKGSKYVQPDVNDIYRAIGSDLIAGKQVLFVGLPCHVAACRQYLQLTRISDKDLTCVDLLCHGVSSHIFFTEELDRAKLRLKMDTVNHVTFRNNRKNQHFHLVILGKNSAGKSVTYDKGAYEDAYFRAFLEGISLNEGCYSCKFSEEKRCGDITIGDFIGLGQQSISPNFEGKAHNASMILSESDKGTALVSRVLEQCEYWNRPYQEAVMGGASLQKPFPRHSERVRFLDAYAQTGFLGAMQLVRGRELQKSQVKYTVKRVMAKLGLDADNLIKMVKRK